MRSLSLLFTSCISVSIVYSQFDLFLAENSELDPSLHLAFDPTLLLDEPNIGESSSIDFTTELNPNLFLDATANPYLTPQLQTNLFLDDDVELNPLIGPERSSSLADDFFCDDDSANGVQLFGKLRRRDIYSCPNFLTGQAVQPDGSDQESQFDLDKLIQFLQRPTPVFESSPDICSPKIFGLSNTPICEVPDITNVAVVPGHAGSILQSVYSVSKDPVGCQDKGAKVWCCMNVAPRTALDIPPEKINEISPDQLELLQRVARLLSNAFVCYPRTSTQPYVGNFSQVS